MLGVAPDIIQVFLGRTFPHVNVLRAPAIRGTSGRSRQQSEEIALFTVKNLLLAARADLNFGQGLSTAAQIPPFGGLGVLRLEKLAVWGLFWTNFLLLLLCSGLRILGLF